MKKKFLFFVIPVLAGVVLFISSCQKEPVDLEGSFYSALSQLDDKAFDARVVEFRSNILDNAKSASGEDIVFFEAVYMMEAAFNRYHGFPAETYRYTVIDTAILPVDYQKQEMISQSDLRKLYIAVNNTIVDHLKAYAMDNLRTMLFNFDFKENGQLYVMTTIGDLETRKSLSGSAFEPFGETDYWSISAAYLDDPAYTLGKCGLYAGEFIGKSDARFEQMKAARKYRGLEMEGYYYINLGDVDVFGYEMWSIGVFGEDCLSPDQMNTHYHLIAGEINNIKNNSYYNVPASKQFVDMSIWVQGSIGTEEEEYRIGKLYCFKTITFGERRKIIGPSVPTVPGLLVGMD